MNNDFIQWAAAKHGTSVQRARSLFVAADTAASAAHNRLDPRYWTLLRKKLTASLGVNVPQTKTEQAVRSLHSLALHLRRSPGTTEFTEEGNKLTLTYQRNSSTGIQYPFTDYCDVEFVYDTERHLWACKGSLFGSTTELAEHNEPSTFFMYALDQRQSYNVVVRDFLARSTKIIERYGAQNLHQFTFKLQQETRNLGTMEYLDASKAPLVAEFQASEVGFSVWYAMSNLGLPTIKFNPSILVKGYSMSVATFHNLLRALDDHVQEHQEFTSACIAAINHPLA